MPGEAIEKGIEVVARITVHSHIKIVFVASIILMAWGILDLSSSSFQQLKHPMFEVSLVGLILGTVCTTAVFTTWYQVDSVGIHKHSNFTKKKEIRWDEMVLVSVGRSHALAVLSNSTRFEFDPRVHSGLPFLGAYLITRVPDYRMMGAKGEVSRYCEDYRRIRSGASKRSIDFRYYGPTMVLFVIFLGVAALWPSFTGAVSWDEVSIGTACAIPGIAGLILYLWKRDAK